MLFILNSDFIYIDKYSVILLTVFFDNCQEPYTDNARLNFCLELTFVGYPLAVQRNSSLILKKFTFLFYCFML